MKQSRFTQNLLLLFIFSIISYSCSNEIIEENSQTNELKLLSNKTISSNSFGDGDCGTKIQVGGNDGSYNCFGLAFSVSETGIKDWVENYEIYNTFITSGLYTEDNSSKATKVLYWNNQADYIEHDYRGIDHAAMIINSSGTVRSKQGATALYENCIDHYYLGGTFFYRTYALNIKLESDISSPIREDTFTVSTPADGRNLGVTYNWSFDPNKISLISNNGYESTFKVKSNAASGLITIGLNATHQTGQTGNNNIAYPKTVSDSFRFYLDPISNPNTPLTASFSGSTYVTPSSMGVWNAVANGGNPTYHYTWWLKRSDGTGGAAYQIGTGSQLNLMTSSTGRPKYIYYDLYLKVYDSSNPIKSYTTAIKVIASTGLLGSAL